MKKTPHRSRSTERERTFHMYVKNSLEDLLMVKKDIKSDIKEMENALRKYESFANKAHETNAANPTYLNQMKQNVGIAHVQLHLHEYTALIEKKKAIELAIEFKTRGKKNTSVLNASRISKSSMQAIYDKYTEAYEDKFNEVIRSNGSHHRADRMACEEVQRQIKKKEKGLEVPVRNIKEAITRRLDRKPIKRGQIKTI